MTRILIVFSALLLVAGCKKDPPEPHPDPVPEIPGSVSIEMLNRAGTADLEFGKVFVTAAGDSVKVSKFNYYLSNIVLVRADGSTFVHPESYFVIRHPNSRKINVPHVPAGTYTSIRMLIGVDSLRNCSGSQTGGLDPSVNGDMFWSWNTGYIFMKLEGTSPSIPESNQAFTFHIGGFKGADKAYRQVNIDLGSTPLVVTDKVSNVKLSADAASVLDGPHLISLKDFSYQMQPGPGAKKLADNYSDMISLESVQN